MVEWEWGIVSGMGIGDDGDESDNHKQFGKDLLISNGELFVMYT